jgi:hypothetical protein
LAPIGNEKTSERKTYYSLLLATTQAGTIASSEGFVATCKLLQIVLKATRLNDFVVPPFFKGSRASDIIANG